MNGIKNIQVITELGEDILQPLVINNLFYISIFLVLPLAVHRGSSPA